MRINSRHWLGVLGLTFVLATPALADRKSRQVRFVDIHPIPKSEGGGLCYIEGPHVHIFAADKVQYRDHHGSNFFVGDPVAYGYDGPRVTYKGHHPIHVHAVVGDDDSDVEYCYLNGPHFHAFSPPPDAGFEVRGDVNFYVAEPPQAYIEARPAFVKINTMYQPLVYDRPVVTVEAPVGWIGARVDVIAPVVVAPAVVVPAPSVEVHVPMPSVHVDIGIGGGVFMQGGSRGKHMKHKKFRGRGKWK
ncbi:MAG: hypothetical protein H0T79_14175 [Deltaproteobacteria bacterium]|nr:hypothetical protein [Deltaproteobacteria bacterium]